MHVSDMRAFVTGTMVFFKTKTPRTFVGREHQLVFLDGHEALPLVDIIVHEGFPIEAWAILAADGKTFAVSFSEIEPSLFSYN